MVIGMVGLGKMGGQMAGRLRAAGIDVVGFDASPQSDRTVDSLAAMAAKLATPRIVWVMVPAGAATDQVIDQLGGLLEPGDHVIDGGNSRYTDASRHAAALAAKGIGFVDVGTSGGVWGGTNGYALMVGGDATEVAAVWPVLEALKPEGDDGLVHAGGVGAGHFAKMIHNGIEYGMMQALGEGYGLLRASPIIENPDAVVTSWRSGSVVRSWLLDLLARALDADAGLAGYVPSAAESGEAKWTVEAALDLGVPVPVTAAALYVRQASQGGQDDTVRVVAALRNQFGGHSAPRNSF